MHTGYQLVRVVDGVVVETWGGIWGKCPGIPSPVYLPNGDHVHAPTVGDVYDGHRLDLLDTGPSTTQVKAESQRRIIAVTGAADFNACLVKQLNAAMRAIELVNKIATGGVLTEVEAAEAAALAALAVSIKAIRARSNEIEALDPIPADFDTEARWS